MHTGLPVPIAEPYLQIQPQEPGETARQIIRAVRQGKGAHEITAMLAKMGMCSLDSDLLACLQGSVHQDMIASIQLELSKIEGNLDTKLLNPTRRIILERFFPKTPVFQEAAAKTSAAARIAYSIKDPEQRNFCSWCIAISEDKQYGNYFGGFFTATTDTSRDIRDQFLDLFTHSAEQVLREMTENCASYLKEKGIDSWPEEKLSGFRGTLLRLGTSFIDQLMELSQSRSDSVMFPPLSKGKSAAYYKDSLKHKIIEYGDASALARTIASIGIIVKVTPKDKFIRQEEAICRIWEWNLEKSEDHEWHKKMLEGKLAFDEGNYHNAWTLFDSAARLHGSSCGGKYDVQMYADLLCHQAHLMMLKGYGVDATEADRKAEAFQTASKKMVEAWTIVAKHSSQTTSPAKLRPYNALSCFEYAFYVFNKPNRIAENELSNAKNCLKTAVEQHCVDAILLQAQLLINGAPGYDTDPAAGICLLESAEYGQSFANAAKQQKRERISLLAAYYAHTENQELAEQYYEEAAQLGSYEATTHLRRKHMTPAHSQRITLRSANSRKVCLFNSDVASGTDSASLNAVLYASLPKESWETTVIGEGSACPLDTHFLDYGQIVFSLMSGKESQNLSDAITIIRFLNEIAGQQAPVVRDDFISRIDLYLLNASSACPLLLDAAMGNLEEGVYFRVHVCDPDLFAANELLTRYPTFYPCISARNGEIRNERWEGQSLSQRCKRRIVVLGTDRSAEVLLKQIIAVTFLESYPTELTIIGQNAYIMEEKLRDDCPGLDPAADRYTGSFIIPVFFKHDLDTLPINRRCDGPDAVLQRILRSADYFIITGADDCENLALGVKLRRNLIRHNPDPDQRPLIAVRYRDHRSAWIASQVAVSSSNYTAESGWSNRYHWTEDYDLHLFGSNAAFECGQLFRNHIEKQALELHKSYYGNTHEANHAATGDFYRRSYNRDSSTAASISLIYQCFGMGVYHRDLRSYSGELHRPLGERYDQLLHDFCSVCGSAVKWDRAANDAGETVEICSRCGNPQRAINPNTLEKAAEIEHARWRCFCASRGWSVPDESTLTSYLRNGSPRHHLEIGLLHPYLLSYANLPSTRDRINRMIEEYGLEIKVLPDPRINDRSFMLKAPALLGNTADSDS